MELLDGIQNILPANISSVTQNTFSSLLDAYKRSELDPATGLAIFALNSRLTDLAEPSESLLATTVAQLGLDGAGYLLSSAQLDRFRAGNGIVTETEVRGRRGAYFVHAAVTWPPAQETIWHLMADVHQDSAAIAQKIHWLQGWPGRPFPGAGRVISPPASPVCGRSWPAPTALQLSNSQLLARLIILRM